MNIDFRKSFRYLVAGLLVLSGGIKGCGQYAGQGSAQLGGNLSGPAPLTLAGNGSFQAPGVSLDGNVDATFMPGAPGMSMTLAAGGGFGGVPSMQFGAQSAFDPRFQTAGSFGAGGFQGAGSFGPAGFQGSGNFGPGGFEGSVTVERPSFPRRLLNGVANVGRGAIELGRRGVNGIVNGAAWVGRGAVNLVQSVGNAVVGLFGG